MRELFTKKSPPWALSPLGRPEVERSDTSKSTTNLQLIHPINYLSDFSDDDTDIDDEPSDNDSEPKPKSSHCTNKPPPLKRRKLEVSYRDQRILKHDARMSSHTKALQDIEHLIKSKKTVYVSGPQGLQARRTLAIQSHLRIVVKQQWFSIDASERAAESHGFAAVWGGQLLRSWTCEYTETRKLPVSKHGCHAKVFSLLKDPAIAAEL